MQTATKRRNGSTGSGATLKGRVAESRKAFGREKKKERSGENARQKN